MIDVIISFLVFISSALMTGCIRHIFSKYALLDLPNERSMHECPTPRGGGVVVISFILFASFILYKYQIISAKELLNFALPLFITMSIALADDAFSLSIKIRAFFYALSAVLFLCLILEELHITIILLSTLFIVWMINLYNFMDGIDGIACIETISVSLFSLIVFYQLNAETLFYLTLVLLFSTFGFLVWNWPPAKIFLGDVGSCSLGLYFSMIAVWSYLEYELPISLWLVLLSVFIADATFTLLKRMLSGDKWYEAHREHAYQKLVKCSFSHRTVTILVFFLNVFLIWPAAYVLYLYPEYSIIMVLAIYAILLIIWYNIQTKLSITQKINNEIIR